MNKFWVCCMRRFSVAVWDGNFIGGNGKLTTQSGTLASMPYVPIINQARMGTNPEELFAASLATCFCMVLIHALNEDGFLAKRIEAKVEIELNSDTRSITDAFLHLKANIQNITNKQLDQYVTKAALNCPINRSILAELHCTYDLYDL